MKKLMAFWLVSFVLAFAPVAWSGWPPNRCTGQSYLSCLPGQVINAGLVPIASVSPNPIPVANGGTGLAATVYGQITGTPTAPAAPSSSFQSLVYPTTTAINGLSYSNSTGSITVTTPGIYIATAGVLTTATYTSGQVQALQISQTGSATQVCATQQRYPVLTSILEGLTVSCIFVGALNDTFTVGYLNNGTFGSYQADNHYNNFQVVLVH